MLLNAVVRMGDESKADARPDHVIRLVVVKTTPHEKRGGAAGPASNGQLLIATNLLDLPAWIIALIYRYRWTIEVCHADYDEKDNLYRGGRWAYSSRTCVIEAGPLVPAVQALRFRRKLMRYVREDVVPPAPRASQSACAAEGSLGSTAAIETGGGAADAEPAGDARHRRAGRTKGGGR